MRMLVSLLIAAASVLTPLDGSLAAPPAPTVVAVAEHRAHEQIDPRCLWWRLTDPARYQRECV